MKILHVIAILSLLESINSEKISLSIQPSSKSKCPAHIPDTDLEDMLTSFRQQLTPHRPFHANGAGAFGDFIVTHDITSYTKAAPFSRIGEKKPIVVRFSTRWGGAGSPDIPINPPESRGFAFKLYTEEGNWDFVASNKIVSSIRDPTLFAELAASRQRRGNSNMVCPNAWWNFTNENPETTLATLQLFSDFAYPDGYRFMDASSPHAVKLVNAEGVAVYCKIHFLAEINAGKNFTFEQAQVANLNNLDYSKQDLYTAIENGDFPSWRLMVQIMTFEEARTSKFNPFDPTKIWPLGKFPLKPVARIILNRNPTDYYSEIEQLALNPGCLVPGMEASPDPILHARMIAYPQGLRQRLGPNYLKLPINLPSPEAQKLGKYYKRHSHQVLWEGEDEDYQQAIEFYDNLDKGERKRLAKNIARWLVKAKKGIQEAALNNFGNVNKQLVEDIKLML